MRNSSKLETAGELIREATLEHIYFDRYDAERLVIGQAPRQLKLDFEFGGNGKITSPTTFEACAAFSLVANGEDGAGVRSPVHAESPSQSFHMMTASSRSSL